MTEKWQPLRPPQSAFFREPVKRMGLQYIGLLFVLASRDTGRLAASTSPAKYCVQEFSVCNALSKALMVFVAWLHRDV